VETVADPDAAAGDAQPEAALADGGAEGERDEDDGDGAGKTEAAAADAVQVEDAVMEEDAEEEEEAKQPEAVDDREADVPAAQVSRAYSLDQIAPPFNATRQDHLLLMITGIKQHHVCLHCAAR